MLCFTMKSWLPTLETSIDIGSSHDHLWSDYFLFSLSKTRYNFLDWINFFYYIQIMLYINISYALIWHKFSESLILSAEWSPLKLQYVLKYKRDELLLQNKWWALLMLFFFVIEIPKELTVYVAILLISYKYYN